MSILFFFLLTGADAELAVENGVGTWGRGKLGIFLRSVPRKERGHKYNGVRKVSWEPLQMGS